MKKILLLVSLIGTSLLSDAQTYPMTGATTPTGVAVSPGTCTFNTAISSACPRICTNSILISPAGANLWDITFRYFNPTNGAKGISIVIKCGTTILVNQCMDASTPKDIEYYKTYTAVPCTNLSSLEILLTPFTGGTGCGGGSCGPTERSTGGGSLPVVLSSFIANLKNSNAGLAWTTVSEKNFNFFEVERSFDGADYKTVSIVFANGNTNSKTNYSYNDNVKEIAKSIIYYRLKMVDIDGSFKYSDVRVIRIGEQAETMKIVTYPNPVVNDVRVTIPASWQNKEVKYEIFNTNGQLVIAKMNANASQTEMINLSNMSRGMYFIKLTMGTETAQQKIIKN